METKKIYPYGCKLLGEIYEGRFEAQKFSFSCRWRGNRSWFVHEWEIYFENRFYPVGSYKIQYYNRTRERFSYESLMRNLFINYLYGKDWRFWDENREEIVALGNDLDCYNLWTVFKKVYWIGGE